MSADDAFDEDERFALGPFPGLGHAKPRRVLGLTLVDEAGATAGESLVAEEVPVAFVYNGRTHAVMMSTPADLEDLAFGFTLTEQVVGCADDIARVDVERHSRGIELRITISTEAAERLSSRARSIAGRTGCGLCGVDAIDDAVRVPRVVASSLMVAPEALWRASEALGRSQPLNADTHAIHAACWATQTGTIVLSREDVGRHNALDKVIGALARQRGDASDGFAVVTSRASFELVQKVAAAGVPLLAAVSRPTVLAVRVAEASGVCLVGLLRGRTANVYAHPERIEK